MSKAITVYEKEVTEEIKRNRNKIWKNISKLRNTGNKEKKEEIQLYNREGKLIPESEIKEEIVNVWQKIYCKHENRIDKNLE